MRVELNYWVAVSTAVRSAIDSGRVGVPVFVRWTVLHAAETEEVDDILGTMAGRVSSWFGGKLDRLYALCSPDVPSAALSLTFSEGPTALLVTGGCNYVNEVDLVLLGNEGAIYHHEFPSERLSGILEPQLDPSIDHLREAISASRHSGQPVSLTTFPCGHG